MMTRNVFQNVTDDQRAVSEGRGDRRRGIVSTERRANMLEHPDVENALTTSHSELRYPFRIEPAVIGGGPAPGARPPGAPASLA